MMRKTLLAGLFLLFLSLPGYGSETLYSGSPTGGDTIITFRFVPGEDMFYVPYGGNNTELDRLYALVDEYRAEITSGRMPVDVDGYCASGETPEASFRIAVTRSNRVKSELIVHKRLVEEHFITKNHVSAYTAPDGKTYRDMVVVTLRIPAKEQPKQPKLVKEEPRCEEPPVEERQPESVVEQQPEPVVEIAVPAKFYCFAVRTNLLYDAFLLPTLGVEWRVNRHIGIKVDGSHSWLGNEKGKVQKIWLVSPEVRWYLLNNKRFYVGVGANIGEYNIYKGMLGSLFSDDTGYQGKLWGAGLTVGYQLCLSHRFSFDFNLGLGYTRMEYDRFTVSNKVRVFKDRDKTKNFWSPTQAGISLIWTIGSNNIVR